jgi:ribonucleoside-diphosphate reductase alpha chain
MEYVKKKTVDGSTQNSDVLSVDKSLKRGIKFKRFFTKEGVHPFDEIQWERRDAVITNEKGGSCF